jgi:CspA family cold shock protein
MSNSASSTVSSSEKFTGRVKWFNNKSGYGFITVTDGSKSGIDVFVHHTSIKVDSEQYKYLVQGEYVEFFLSDTKTDNHEYQAGDVCGIKGGKLMCETRSDLRSSRLQYTSTKSTDDTVTAPKSVQPPTTQNHRTRIPESKTQGVWTHVGKPTNESTDSRPQQRGGRGRGDGGRGRGRPGRGDGRP